VSSKQSRKRRVRVDAPRPGKQPVAEPAVDEIVEAAECACPRLDLDDWHEVESDWSDIQFLKSALTALAGVPIGFAGAREKLANEAVALGMAIPESPMLLLGEGRFRRPVLLEVETEIEHPRLIRPGGFTWSRVLPASFGQIKNLAAETRQKAEERFGRAPEDFWVWYLTCAVCSEARNWETMFVAHYRDA
jgi:hypothetical protein